MKNKFSWKLLFRDKDLTNGIFFVVMALLFVGYTFVSYPLGSSTEMGPGYFPLLIAVLILIFSLILIANRLLRGRFDVVSYREWGALIKVNSSILFFAICLPYLGLILSTIGMIMISNLGNLVQSWKSSLAVSVSISLTGYVLFVFFLGVYVPVIPRFVSWN